jgi:c-di-GMP-related signal transduction protein
MVDGFMAAGTHAVHVGRQPIYDSRGNVVAYELLFRGQADAVEAESQGPYATSQVLVNACTEFGLDRLVGGRLAFVNLTREFLVGELPLPFGPERAVLEVLETVPVDDEVITGVTELVAMGYAIALDDFVVGSHAERLVDLATYVKIDTLGVDPVGLAAIAAASRRDHLRLVAERVESPAGLAEARALGFELFQGYALSRPEVVSAPRLAPSRLRTIRLLALLSDPTADMANISELVTADPALCYRLLTAANAAATGAGHRITSLAQAAVLVGVTRLRQWLTLMALTDIAANEHQATAVLINARFCQQIAADLALPIDAAFTVGMLDGVCELIGESPERLVAGLPLTDDLVAALVGGTGPLGMVLATARAYRTEWQAPADGTRHGTAMADLAGAYLRAVDWTQTLVDASA